MAQWDHGYVTDVAYTTGAGQEMTPAWIDACSILLGYRPASSSAPFRYADIGCGNGMNAIFAAAARPDSEVWGYDFNPAHIEFARGLASQAGLTNVHFEETSFEALARGPEHGDLDYVVSHGVLSWISEENRRHLVNVVGKRLRPGGLAYISYNTTTGWASMLPIRTLMRQVAKSSQRRSDTVVADILQVLETLKTGGATYLSAHPTLPARVEQIRNQDPRYIAHEYLNQDWHPLMFDEVREAMVEAKTTFIGSATLTENSDVVAVQPALLPLMNSITDVSLRETVRDLAAAKAFRRDLWRKGGEIMPAPEQISYLDAITLVWTGKPIEGEITFPSPIGSVTGQAEFYRPILDAICRGPSTVGALRALPSVRNHPIGEFVQATSLLIGGGFAHPAQRGGDPSRARDASERLNAAILDRIRLGRDLDRLAAPVIGSSIGVSVLEAMTIGGLLVDSKRSAAALIDIVRNQLIASARTLRKDGNQVDDGAVANSIIGEVVSNVMSKRLASLRASGVMS